MVANKNLEKIVRTLLSDSKVSQFSMDWILNSPQATEHSVREVYRFLRGKGLKDDKIASQAHLLGRNPETIERNYQRLSALGLKDDKIASLAELLGIYHETIERNYKRLSALGLKEHKIASQAELLGRDPETIERNYKNHIILLRQDYKDRTSGRDLLLTYAQLLGIPSDTIESNVQFLYSIGVGYNNGILLGTTPQLKRKKMAWMLRELFDYKSLPQDQRKDSIEGLYDFIRDNPRILTMSINYLEKNKDALREKSSRYIR